MTNSIELQKNSTHNKNLKSFSRFTKKSSLKTWEETSKKLINNSFVSSGFKCTYSLQFWCTISHCVKLWNYLEARDDEKLGMKDKVFSLDAKKNTFQANDLCWRVSQSWCSCEAKAHGRKFVLRMLVIIVAALCM